MGQFFSDFPLESGSAKFVDGSQRPKFPFFDTIICGITFHIAEMFLIELSVITAARSTKPWVSSLFDP